MTPKEKTLKWVETQLKREREKWEIGSKSNYYQWQNWYESLLDKSSKGIEPSVLEHPCNNCMQQCTKDEKYECKRYQEYNKANGGY